jgi:uncharacterized 2Fe-2S/4Fe-4S cluster protein (DUF4445 family)
MADGRRTTTSLAEPANKLLLPLHPKARAYGMPIISGHVGADAAACMLAVDVANEERLIAIMDIGTNRIDCRQPAQTFCRFLSRRTGV